MSVTASSQNAAQEIAGNLLKKKKNSGVPKARFFMRMNGNVDIFKKKKLDGLRDFVCVLTGLFI